MFLERQRAVTLSTSRVGKGWPHTAVVFFALSVLQGVLASISKGNLIIMDYVTTYYCSPKESEKRKELMGTSEVISKRP